MWRSADSHILDHNTRERCRWFPFTYKFFYLTQQERASWQHSLSVLCCNSDQLLWLKELLIGIPPVNIYLPICKTESRPKCKVFCELPRGQFDSLPNVCNQSLKSQTEPLRSFLAYLFPEQNAIYPKHFISHRSSKKKKKSCLSESCNSLIHIRIRELARVVVASLSRENHFYRPCNSEPFGWIFYWDLLWQSHAHPRTRTHTEEESSQEICHFLAVF